MNHESLVLVIIHGFSKTPQARIAFTKCAYSMYFKYNISVTH